jgi:capsular exopolysaccharide synthesis family protein
MQDQKRVIKSYDLIEKAVEKLDLGVSYFIVGRLKTTEQFHNTPFFLKLNSVNSSVYEKTIDFKILSVDEYSLTYEKGDEVITNIHRFNEAVNTTSYSLITYANLTDKAVSTLTDIDYQVVYHSINSLVNTFSRSITLEDEPYTSILKVQVTDYIPARAKTFLDTLSKVYINYTLEKEISINENTLIYIEKQLSEVTQILDSIELELENYKASQSILNISREEEEYFNQLAEFDKEKRALKLRLESLYSLETYIITNEGEPLVPPALYILDDDFLKTSINELYTMQISRSEELFGKTEDSQAILYSDKKLESLRGTILVYLEKSKIAITDKIGQINVQISELTALIRDVPKTQRDILNIQRKIAVNEKMYLFLLENRASTVIARASILPKSTIIEKARSLGVIGPNKTRTIILATGAGFLLAALIGFIRFLFFDRIESTRELKKITNLSVISGIPVYEGDAKGKVEVEASPRSGVAESFRSIRANLQYYGRVSGHKTILVTSLHPGEGKTFVSTNLAIILAKANKRVIIIDFDLHKPKVNVRLGIDNDKGISSYLIGKETLPDIIKRGVHKNLDVIPAGPVPPNASEIIISDKTEQIIDELKEMYDYVIIDTPPLLLISDSQVLVNHVDMALFVLNSQKASREGVKYLEEFVNKLDTKSTALILNNIKIQRWKYYYGKVSGKYGYIYGDGYGYGSENYKSDD